MHEIMPQEISGSQVLAYGALEAGVQFVTGYPGSPSTSVVDALKALAGYNDAASLEQIAKDTDRDYYMSGEEAREYGIVDQVVTHRPPAGGSGNGPKGSSAAPSGEKS